MRQEVQSAAAVMPERTLPVEFIEVGSGEVMRRIAVRRRDGAAPGPGLFWLSGFKSDMGGIKAAALDRWAAAHGRRCVRFDYSGHGESGGGFTDGTISRWLEETLAVWDACCRGPQVVVGSSMGGWLALLLARALRHRETAGGDDAGGLRRDPLGADLPGASGEAASIVALVLIAPAVDFTEELMWKRFPDHVKRQLETTGLWERPSPYSEEPYPITAGLIEDGRRNLLLGGLIETGCPVRILQGVADPDVPWSHAVELVSRLAQDDVVLSLIKDGDHRLSRSEDVERLIVAVAEFCDGAGVHAPEAGSTGPGKG
jgi:pimeloyl-ACP methyl ester carboxylesterase